MARAVRHLVAFKAALETVVAHETTSPVCGLGFRAEGLLFQDFCRFYFAASGFDFFCSRWFRACPSTEAVLISSAASLKRLKSMFLLDFSKRGGFRVRSSFRENLPGSVNSSWSLFDCTCQIETNWMWKSAFARFGEIQLKENRKLLLQTLVDSTPSSSLVPSAHLVWSYSGMTRPFSICQISWKLPWYHETCDGAHTTTFTTHIKARCFGEVVTAFYWPRYRFR